MRRLDYPLEHSIEKHSLAGDVLYDFFFNDKGLSRLQDALEKAFEEKDIEFVVGLANKHCGIALIDGSPAVSAKDYVGFVALAALELMDSRKLFEVPLEPCEVCGEPIPYRRRNSSTCGQPCQNKLSARSLKRKAAARLRQRARRRVESGKLSDTKYQKLTVEIEKILRGEEHEAIMRLDALSKKYGLGPIEKLPPGRPKRRG